MLHITQGTQTNIVFTGTESALLTNPYWLLIFTNRGTGDVVAGVYSDLSSYKKRYNEVAIEANKFSTLDTGLWQYDVYEQSSSSGTSTAGKNKVESGYMYLHPANGFSRDEYIGQNNTFVTHG